MSKGFNGIPGNLQAMMKQAQKMQEQLQKVQESADSNTAEGSAGGGVVKVVANGKNQIVSLSIAKEAVNPEDVSFLEQLIVTAVNDALTKVQEIQRGELSKITGGMNIPGLF